MCVFVPKAGTAASFFYNIRSKVFFFLKLLLGKVPVTKSVGVCFLSVVKGKTATLCSRDVWGD